MAAPALATETFLQPGMSMSCTTTRGELEANGCNPPNFTDVDLHGDRDADAKSEARSLAGTSSSLLLA
eukprot:1509216-Prorocentrum_lima.AAC.1